MAGAHRLRAFVHYSSSHPRLWLSVIMHTYCYYFARGSGGEVLMSTSVCVSVCLSGRISVEPHAWSLPNFLCMLSMAVSRSSSRVTISQGEGAIFGVFSPLTMDCMRSLQITSCSRWIDHSVTAGGDGSAQHGQSVIYQCLVVTLWCCVRALVIFMWLFLCETVFCHVWHV